MKYNVLHQTLNNDDTITFDYIGSVEATHVNPEVQNQTALALAQMMYPSIINRIAVELA